MSATPPPPTRGRALAAAALATLAALGGRPAPGRAQTAAAPALQFRHLGVADGLASSFVSDIARDGRGVMWVGTAHGVSRYDGYRFRNYGHDRGDPASLPEGVVAQVYEDRAGDVWVATPGGVSRYDRARDRFVTYMADTAAGASLAVRVSRSAAAPRAVTSVVEDAGGTFWVGTSAGLYALDRRTGVATRRALAPDHPAPHVNTLHVDRRSRLWVGTRDGLYVLGAPGSPTPGAPATHYGYAPDARGLPDSVVRALAEDPAGGMWVATGDGGLARLDERSGRFERFRHRAADPNSLAKDRLVRLLADRSGAGLWVGTENGGLDFLEYQSRRITHHRFDPNVPSGIGSNSLWALYQSEDGVLWVGTYSGGLDVSLPTGGALRHYATVPGDSTSLGYNAVPAFAEDRAGHVWIATDGGGLNMLDPATGRFTRYTPQNSSLNSEAVVGLCVDHEGTLWVATWQGGVSRFDARRRRFVPYSTRTSDIPDDNVYEILEDRRGRLWAGTENGFVAEFDRQRGRFPRRVLVKAPGLPPSAVVQLKALRDGTFAVGLRDGGVTVFDPATGAQRHYVAGHGLANNSVHAVLEGGEPGVLWVGTDDGLDRIDRRTGQARHYGVADGLPSKFVEGLVTDGAGRLWVSTDAGLARLDARDAGGAGGGRLVRAFTRADGVQGGEFLMRSAFRAHDGTLYFGGNTGFTTVRPDRVVDAPGAPAVAITGMQLFNRPAAVGAPGSPLARALDAFGPGDELRLTHAQNVLAFEFAAPDYAAPARVRYAYRLDGFDTGWQEAGFRHAASYTNLAPGRYTFRVRATAGAEWAGEGAAVRVVVLPPWWGTWWFRLLAAGAAGVAAWRFVRFRERRRVEVELSRQALRDPLTGLANRALFRDRVGHALARLTREGPPADGGAGRVAALFLDLDDFKHVNDSLGHAAGDELLCAVSARLLNATRGCDTVARLGGDEFAVLLENARGPEDAHAVAERIAEALRAPVRVGTAEARVGVSVGIAFAEPGVDADALLRNADAAMYRAKGEGKGRHAVFDPALVAAAAARLELERDLARAVAGLAGAAPEFALAYQPVVSLATGAVAKAEALLRWRHPRRGLVSPAEFIPAVEASGLIVALGRWVLEEACRAAATWPAGPDGGPVRVSVNVSGRQLLDPALPGHVTAALAAAGLPASRLTLEITETVIMHDTDATLAVLRALKALGVRLAVDDFGTGYSSLRYLRQFPVDVLKIDKSFVDGIARGGPDAALARTIVALGDMLGLRTVAEGVEHEAQAEALRAMGCGFGQGYLFARPMDGGALLALLEAGAGTAA